MCRIDYADDEGRWMVAPTVRKAAKEHKCGDCGRLIVKGEHYTYAKWLDGVFHAIHMCQQCIAAGGWLKVVCKGHLYPGVVEELREHWDEEWKLRSLGLGRLVKYGERGWRSLRSDELVSVALIERWVEDGVEKARRVGAV